MTVGVDEGSLVEVPYGFVGFLEATALAVARPKSKPQKPQPRVIPARKVVLAAAQVVSAPAVRVVPARFPLVTETQTQMDGNHGAKPSRRRPKPSAKVTTVEEQHVCEKPPKKRLQPTPKTKTKSQSKTKTKKSKMTKPCDPPTPTPCEVEAPAPTPCEVCEVEHFEWIVEELVASPAILNGPVRIWIPHNLLKQ